MESKKQDKSQITAGSTDLAAASDKKRKLKIYGIVAAALVFGTIGAYTLLFSKADTCTKQQSDAGQCGAPAQPQTRDPVQLTSGQVLSTNQSVVSNNGFGNTKDLPYYRLSMQADGNLAMYNAADQLLWQSGTAGTGSNNRLVLQTDGNLVVYTAAGQAVWNTATFGGGTSKADTLLMQPDGNAVLYAPKGPVWSTSTGVIGVAPPHNDNNGSSQLTQLKSGQAMSVNQLLTTDSHDTNISPVYVLALQPDGNLVVYNGARRPIWQSGTAGTGSNNRLVLQTDGNLVLYTAAGRAVWNTATFGTGASKGTTLLMQPDGNLVLYSQQNGPVWSSFTGPIAIAQKR